MYNFIFTPENGSSLRHLQHKTYSKIVLQSIHCQLVIFRTKLIIRYIRAVGHFQAIFLIVWLLDWRFRFKWHGRHAWKSRIVFMHESPTTLFLCEFFFEHAWLVHSPHGWHFARNLDELKTKWVQDFSTQFLNTIQVLLENVHDYIPYTEERNFIFKTF